MVLAQCWIKTLLGPQGHAYWETLVVLQNQKSCWPCSKGKTCKAASTTRGLLSGNHGSNCRIWVLVFFRTTTPCVCTLIPVGWEKSRDSLDSRWPRLPSPYVSVNLVRCLCAALLFTSSTCITVKWSVSLSYMLKNKIWTNQTALPCQGFDNA